VNLNDLSETPPAGTPFTFNDVTYSLVDGLIEDYGSLDVLFEGNPDSHYNYDFNVIDDEFELVSAGGETFYDADEFNIVLYAELFSPGTSGFQPGTFEFMLLDGMTIEDVEDKFIFEIFELLIVRDRENEEADLYFGTGGTISVIENSDLNYTLTYDLTVQQVDLDLGEFIPNTEQNISLTYTGDFNLSNETGSIANGRSDKKKRLTRR
jgi:hypothetical protein